MKALSVRQPWAHLILSGQKDVENRSWRCSYRGPLLIHASQRLDTFAMQQLPVDHEPLVRGAILGMVTLTDVVDWSPSPWFEGPYGWVFERPRLLVPLLWHGSLSFFEVPERLLRFA